MSELEQDHKQHVEYIDHMGSDKRVVEAARISFAQDAGKEWTGKDAGLLSFLATHDHWTPFAHPQITLRMRAPVPIRTQCFKHKVGFVENEESRRYISTDPVYYMPTFREATDKKKQGSGGEFPFVQQKLEQEIFKRSMLRQVDDYDKALLRGVCEEQARFYLPQGIMVNWYWTGSLAAFARFGKQRMDSHAQKEIQELAKMVSDIIQPLFPVSWEALTKPQT